MPVPPNQVDVDAYRYVTSWAEPDISSAAEALEKLYRNPDLRNQLGRQAMTFIREHFSTTNFKESIESLLSSD